MLLRHMFTLPKLYSAYLDIGIHGMTTVALSQNFNNLHIELCLLIPFVELTAVLRPTRRILKSALLCALIYSNGSFYYFLLFSIENVQLVICQTIILEGIQLMRLPPIARMNGLPKAFSVLFCVTWKRHVSVPDLELQWWSELPEPDWYKVAHFL